MVGRLLHLRRSRSRRARTTPTVRLRGQQALLPCIGVILDTVKSWIETETASPARSSKASMAPSVYDGVANKVIHPLLHVFCQQRQSPANKTHRGLFTGLADAGIRAGHSAFDGCCE